jgi:hypothetical protein
MTRDTVRTEDLFVIRIWREPSRTGAKSWRGCSDHVGSGQRFFFSNFEDLSDFIRLRLETDECRTAAKGSP